MQEVENVQHEHESKQTFADLYQRLQVRPEMMPISFYGLERLQELAECWQCCRLVEEAYDTFPDFPSVEGFLGNLRHIPVWFARGDGRTTWQRWICLRFM